MTVPPSETATHPVTPGPTAMPVHHRVRHGMRRPHNWVQLIKFSGVGATGYVINLAVYSALLKGAGVHYRTAAVLAFCVAVTNNFMWNRHWTFRARHGHAGFQAARFFAVSITTFLVALGILQLLVDNTSLPTIVAQAISIVAATPLNFIGNKMWTFRRTEARRP